MYYQNQLRIKEKIMNGLSDSIDILLEQLQLNEAAAIEAVGNTNIVLDPVSLNARIFLNVDEGKANAAFQIYAHPVIDLKKI